MILKKITFKFIIVLILLVLPLGEKAFSELNYHLWPDNMRFFESPSDISADKEGNIYIADSGNQRIKKYDSLGNLLFSWGTEGNADGQFNFPRIVAVDGKGNVFVVDYSVNNYQIQKFNSFGVFITKWALSFQPRDMAFDAAGNLYIIGHPTNLDNPISYIEVFDNNGNYLKGISKTGDTGYSLSPTGIAISNGYIYTTENVGFKKLNMSGELIDKRMYGGHSDEDGCFYGASGIIVDNDGIIYVVDSNNLRIQRFAPDMSYLGKWGTSGVENGEFSLISLMDMDIAGNIYVADKGNNRIQKFSKDGIFLDKWRAKGSGKGEFINPMYIAKDSSGSFYVSDTGNSRIQKFTKDGTFLAEWGSGYWSEGGLRGPTGIAIDGSDNVYVADTGNSRINKYSANGVLLAKYNNLGTDNFYSPYSIAFDHSGNIYILDASRCCVFKSDPAMNLIKKWGEYGSDNGKFNSPSGLVMDNADNIYVADTGNNRIQKFNSNGDFVRKWGSEGTAEGEFSTPFGVAIDGQGNILVTDTYNNRIQSFNSDGDFISASGTYGTGMFKFNSPVGIMVDNENNIYVVDYGNYRIHKFNLFLYYIKGYVRSKSGKGIDEVTVNLTGDSVANYSTMNGGYFEFLSLSYGNYSLRVSKENYVFNPVTTSILVNTNKENIEFMGVPGDLAEGDFLIVGGEKGYLNTSRGDKASIVLNPSISGTAIIKIYNIVGSLMWENEQEVSEKVKTIVTWNGKNMNNQRVASGVYLIHVAGAGISKTRKMALVK